MAHRIETLMVKRYGRDPFLRGASFPLKVSEAGRPSQTGMDGSRADADREYDSGHLPEASHRLVSVKSNPSQNAEEDSYSRRNHGGRAAPGHFRNLGRQANGTKVP
jgi:hypothetical protein